MVDIDTKKTKVKKTSQKVVEKTTKKVVQKETAIKTVPAKKEVLSKASEVSVDMVDLTGKSSGKVLLPGAIFSAKVNPTLMAQAVRVYQFSQRRGTSSTKTRGEVSGTTKKIYRQKGTGRARHGAAKAPIFVGGGIAFGPKPRDFGLELPKKMKRGALFSALTYKLSQKHVVVFDGAKVSGKTKEMSGFIKAMDKENKKVTVVVDGDTKKVSRAAGNVHKTTVIRAENLNTYAVLNGGTLFFVKESIETLKKTFLADK